MFQQSQSMRFPSPQQQMNKPNNNSFNVSWTETEKSNHQSKDRIENKKKIAIVYRPNFPTHFLLLLNNRNLLL
jgi:hypothetical protein